ncbi:MAG: ABC transporter substrate-binding protein [Aquabacterium sp.]|nr:MAG: ABC transporter substrate-binding protein [Aquabacterium sp.]
MKRRELLGAFAAAPLLANGALPTPRIVSITGGFTEIVYALGGESALVGTDITSLWPEAAQRTPKVGYMRTLSAEGLLSLRPTAVLATDEAGPPAVLEQLRGAGVALELVHADHSFAEVQRKIGAAARVLGRVAEGKALDDRLARDWQATQQAVAAASARRRRAPRVLFVMSRTGTPQVAGTHTAAHAVIGMAGGVNAMTAYAGYRAMTAESAAAAAPDVVLVMQEMFDAAGSAEQFWAGQPMLQLTAAARERRLVAMDSLYLLGFGPRLPQAVRELASRI